MRGSHVPLIAQIACSTATPKLASGPGEMHYVPGIERQLPVTLEEVARGIKLARGVRIRHLLDADDDIHGDS